MRTKAQNAHEIAALRDSAPMPPGRLPFANRFGTFSIYNVGMDYETFLEIKRYVDFQDSDAVLLRGLADRLRPAFPAVVDRFYSALLENPRTRGVFTEGDAQVRRLRVTLMQWLAELFGGQYDRDYLDNRHRIGRTHVRVGLPQQFMISSITLVRDELSMSIRALNEPEETARRAAVDKILGIDLAIINGSYLDELLSHMQAMERAQYEQQLRESEHLATIGRLAASLAHEIKNPLAGISGAIQVIGADIRPGHPHHEVMVEIMRQIDRLDSAVRDLLIYARPKPPQRRLHDLSTIIERALILFREEPTCRHVRVLCEGLGQKVEAPVDDGQIHQVLTNLLLNAAQACKTDGRIWCRLRPNGRGAQIQVEDDGAGMPPEIMRRVFEPFYTTKARGTGLGLPICKRIVETHGGSIHLDSRCGHGTRVTIDLPSEHVQAAHPDH